MNKVDHKLSNEYLEGLFKNWFNFKIIKILADVIEENFSKQQITDILEPLDVKGLSINKNESEKNSILKIFIDLKEYTKTKTSTEYEYYRDTILGVPNGDEMIVFIIEEFMDLFNHKINKVRRKAFAEWIGDIVALCNLILEIDSGDDYIILTPDEYRDFLYEKKEKELIQNNPNYFEEMYGGTPTKDNRQVIHTLEIQKLENEYAKLTVFINKEYEKPMTFKRGKNWSYMYSLAQNEGVYDQKDFMDYFNSNQTNPLYKRYGFEVSKILRQESGQILPNIKIEMITKKKVTQNKT